MDKPIFAVEFDPVKSQDQTYTKKVILGEKYMHDITGEELTVNAISEELNNGQRTIKIHYTNFQDDEIFDIYHIYRKLK